MSWSTIRIEHIWIGETEHLKRARRKRLARVTRIHHQLRREAGRIELKNGAASVLYGNEELRGVRIPLGVLAIRQRDVRDVGVGWNHIRVSHAHDSGAESRIDEHRAGRTELRQRRKLPNLSVRDRVVS